MLIAILMGLKTVYLTCTMRQNYCKCYRIILVRYAFPCHADYITPSKGGSVLSSIRCVCARCWCNIISAYLQNACLSEHFLLHVLFKKNEKKSILDYQWPLWIINWRYKNRGSVLHGLMSTSFYGSLALRPSDFPALRPSDSPTLRLFGLYQSIDKVVSFRRLVGFFYANTH